MGIIFVIKLLILFNNFMIRSKIFVMYRINKVVIKLIINEIGECYLQDVLKLQT
jgi:hypothetical protein